MIEPDLRQNYAAPESFDGQLPFGRPALIAIDVARAYLEPGSPLYDPAFVTALPVMARLIAAAREAGVPVVFTRVSYQPGGIDGGLFYRKLPALRCFDADNPLNTFPDNVAPRPGDLMVTKQYASAFFGTPLAPALLALGVDTVVLTGFSTSGCVRASALDALQHGFAPFVASDSCADRHPTPHEASLFDIQAKYGEVRASDEIARLFRAAADARRGD